MNLFEWAAKNPQADQRFVGNPNAMLMSDMYAAMATNAQSLEKQVFDRRRVVIEVDSFVDMFTISIKSLGGVSPERLKDIIERYHEVTAIETAGRIVNERSRRPHDD